MSRRSKRLALFGAVLGVVLVALQVGSLVPRVRLVEALALAATAVGAGAALTKALVEWRRNAPDRVSQPPRR